MSVAFHHVQDNVSCICAFVYIPNTATRSYCEGHFLHGRLKLNAELLKTVTVSIHFSGSLELLRSSSYTKHYILYLKRTA